MKTVSTLPGVDPQFQAACDAGWNAALETAMDFMKTHSIGYGCPGSTFIHETTDDSVGSDRFMWIREFEKWKRR